MIVKKCWRKRLRFNRCYVYTGIFLFGFIPLYLSRIEIEKDDI